PSTRLPGSSPCVTATGPRSGPMPPRRSGPRRASGWRSASLRSGWPPGTTASSAAPTKTVSHACSLRREMETLRGLILSGGAGTRLRPITYTSAKQLVPVANKPVLFYGIEALKEAGVSEIGIVIAPNTGEEIAAAVGDGSAFGCSITYIPQAEPLGLAHAVLTAEEFLQDGPFVMYLGDNLLRDGIVDLVEAFRSSEPDALILLTKVPHPSRYGVAELDGARVVRLVEKPAEP